MRAWLVALLLLASINAHAQSFDTYLDEADQVRTTNRNRFDQLMTRLDQLAGQATPAQRMELRLLHAYTPLLNGDNATSIKQLKQLLAAKPGDLIRYRANVMLMTNYVSRGEFSDALQALERVLALRSSISDPGFRQQGAIAAAILYNEVGQYPLAVRYANEVLSSPVTARNGCIAGETLVDAKLNLAVPQTDESIESAIQRCKAINEHIPSGRLVAFLARKWMGEGKNVQAIDLLRSQMAGVEATRYPLIVGEVKATLAEALYNHGDLDAAKLEASRVVAIKSAIAKSRPLASAYEILSDIAVQQHDLQSALDSYRLYADVNKEYLTEVKTRALAYQLVRVESVQKNQQIQLLNRQNSLLQLQQRVDKQKAENSRLLMLLFAAFALIIAYWGYKMRRLHVSLRRMAQTDALTGICNRHHFTAQSEKMLVHCAKVGEQVSLIMFDLDHFKVINDTYGHVTGDWVLKEVAKTCAELCRRMDYFGRLGGEEFAILLQGCDARAATRIADDCRMRISRIQSAPSGHAFTISASFGVSCTASSGYDLDKLISHSDQMLYRAKREGRNRVKTYTHDVPMEMREPAPWHETMQQSVDAAGQVDPDVPALGAMNA
jgi:diguanylate cyclase (GGDEF)-like protein